MTSREATQTFYILLEDLWDVSKGDFLFGKVDWTLPKKKQLQEAIVLLSNNTPVQHITGKAFFYDSLFSISKDTLVPRPETEELVALILKTQPVGPQKGLDIGTGSGCIPITLSKNRTYWTMEGIDVSAEALQMARKNAAQLGVDVQWILADILTTAPPVEAYDFIVSNPPYIPSTEVDTLNENVLNFDPRIALEVPDDDPLQFYKCIVQYAHKALVSGGGLYLEIHENYGLQTLSLLQDEKWRGAKIIVDLSGKNRMIYAQKALD